MHADQIILKFDTIQNRMKELVARLHEVEVKFKNSEEENEALKAALKKQEHILKNLYKTQEYQQKDFVKRDFFVKLVQNTRGSTDDLSDLKKTLDEYIKEIEHCIAYLSN